MQMYHKGPTEEVKEEKFPLISFKCNKQKMQKVIIRMKRRYKARQKQQQEQVIFSIRTKTKERIWFVV